MTKIMEASTIISSLRTKQEAASLRDNGKNLRCRGGLQVVHLGGQDLTFAIPMSKGQSPHQLNSLCGCFHGQCLQLSCSSAARTGTPWIPKQHACVPMCVLGDGGASLMNKQKFISVIKNATVCTCPANSSSGLLFSCRRYKTVPFLK